MINIKLILTTRLVIINIELFLQQIYLSIHLALIVNIHINNVNMVENMANT